jgi:hypothetical protein
MTEEPRRRPVTVTTVAVLTILAAAAALFTGIGLFATLAMPQVVDRTRNPQALLFVAFVASWCVAGGLIQLVGAAFLLRGARWARLLLTVLFVLHIGFSAATSVAMKDGPSTVVLVTVAAAVALLLLWNARASAWFDRSRRYGGLRSSGQEVSQRE